MSARIPHLLTHLLSSDDLDALRSEMLAKASTLTGPAVILLDQRRSESFQRRAKLTPSARRKTLGLRYTR